MRILSLWYVLRLLSLLAWHTWRIMAAVLGFKLTVPELRTVRNVLTLSVLARGPK